MKTYMQTNIYKMFTKRQKIYAQNVNKDIA